MGKFAQTYGLHPLIAVIVIGADSILMAPETVGAFFGIESTGISAAIAVVITIIVAVILAVACLLLQKYSYKDNWGTAIGKALIIGVLVVIPTSIPTIIGGGASGVIGTVGLIKQSRAKKLTAETKNIPAKKEQPSGTSKKTSKKK
jgi:hypothetical protein